MVQRPINVIAEEIKKIWGKGSMYNIYYAARPYLSAMYCLTSLKDNYGADNARTIIAYFVANASRWRGEDARRIKKELKSLK